VLRLSCCLCKRDPRRWIGRGVWVRAVIGERRVRCYYNSRIRIETEVRVCITNDAYEINDRIEIEPEIPCLKVQD